jgi:8-oxo-dGTP pyrophosphatase MutT (NUDIX family)
VSPKPATARQFAALPYRRSKSGNIEVLLVTSRETRRWIIPKGWPISGVEPHNLAALEAMEEAGVTGEVEDVPIGAYRYEKKRSDGTIVMCTVDTFALKVEERMPTWPEQEERERKWFSLDEAAQKVQEPELRVLIKKLVRHLG